MMKKWSIDGAQGKDKELREIVRVRDEMRYGFITDKYLYREGKGHQNGM